MLFFLVWLYLLYRLSNEKLSFLGFIVLTFFILFAYFYTVQVNNNI